MQKLFFSLKYGHPSDKGIYFLDNYKVFMKHILKIVVLGMLLILGLSSCGTQNNDIINPDADYIYYYGITCPHCKDLNEYMEANDIYHKVSIEKKEVWKNEANQQEFEALAQKLQIPEDKLWVPFIYEKATNKYYIGWDAKALFEELNK